jgi:hypothetical protein
MYAAGLVNVIEEPVTGVATFRSERSPVRWAFVPAMNVSHNIVSLILGLLSDMYAPCDTADAGCQSISIQAKPALIKPKLGELHDSGKG